MGCLIALLARVALGVVWLATPLVNGAFGGDWILPLLGIIFLPITGLVYVLVYVPGIGVTGWSWAWVAVALMLDLATHSSAAYSNRRRIIGSRAS